MTLAANGKPTDEPEKSLRDLVGADGAKLLHDRLDAALDGKGQSFVVIYSTDSQQLTDVYLNVCERCVIELIGRNTFKAVSEGRLVAEAVAKMHGHAHGPIKKGPSGPKLSL